MRLIDADKLEIKILNIGTPMFPKMRPVIYLEDIEDAPTIDAEPIVRCKDCKYFYLFNGRSTCKRNAEKVYGIDNYYGLIAVNKNDFCSYGAKMNEDK